MTRGKRSSVCQELPGGKEKRLKTSQTLNTMPKGFLVKRSKRVGPVSYKVRNDAPSPLAPGVLSSFGFPNFWSPVVPLHHQHQLHLSSRRVESTPTPGRLFYGGLPESCRAPSLSPTLPDSVPSPDPGTAAAAAAESRSASPSPALGSFGSPAFPSLPEMTTQLDSFREAASTSPKLVASSSSKASKKRKSPSREKRHRNDLITTSPVLGLRIKDPELDPNPNQDPDRNRELDLNRSSALGEFICQLCKERYSDPLGLAGHKCSRMVSVEYRCEECQKSFSCPANLASHRRWHKPRANSNSSSSSSISSSCTGSGSPQTAPISEKDRKEKREKVEDGEREERGEEEEGEEEEEEKEELMPFSCPQCAKKFRRLAYLRKHLALHMRRAAESERGIPKMSKINLNSERTNLSTSGLHLAGHFTPHRA